MALQAEGSDWAAAEAEIGRIVAESAEPFASDTVAQVRELLTFLRERCPAPEVTKGYGSTISFTWKESSRGPLEVEIFGNRLEVYRFYDRRTDIRHFAHISGEPCPPELVAELPTL
ncbi:MAG: hypothetical protein ACREDZ_02385 [Kiloniellales bacterium]